MPPIIGFPPTGPGPLLTINPGPTPRLLENIRFRLVLRLDRHIDPISKLKRRANLKAIQRAILKAAKTSYPQIVPPQLDKQAIGWDFSIEPAFPGATTKVPYRLWSYYILSLPAVRGRDLGCMWDLAHQIVRDVKDVELAYPESFGDRFKLLSAGVAAVAPGDMAWSLWQMKVPEARAFAASQGRAAGGEGIVVGHLDTGWAQHPQLEPGLIDETRQKNTLSVMVVPPRLEPANDATDPYTGLPDVFHAHGVATASVLASRGEIFQPDQRSKLPGATFKSGTGTAGRAQTWSTAVPLPPNAEVVGVAPGATVLPIRCADTVILTGDIEVAQAVWYAAQENVDVITMSLGGVPSPLLHAALAYAVNSKNIIFCAAAGNLVPFVVFPAAYPEAIACAGSQPDGKPWRAAYGSSFGPQVDVSAPAQGVWIADIVHENNASTLVVQPSQGTSFAAPAVAGAAAVWLGFHSRAALLERYQGIALQDVFRTLLKRTSTNLSDGPSWPSDFGAGVVDLDRLLRTPLPLPKDVELTAPWSPDAFMGYLADGVTTVAGLAGLSRLPPSVVSNMLLLEVAQLVFSNTDFAKTVTNFANGVQQTAAKVVQDIGTFVNNAVKAVSQFLKDLFRL